MHVHFNSHDSCVHAHNVKLMTLELLTQLPITPKQGNITSGHSRSESNSSFMSFSSSMKDALAMLDEDLEQAAEVTSGSSSGTSPSAGAGHAGRQGA